MKPSLVRKELVDTRRGRIAYLDEAGARDRAWLAMQAARLARPLEGEADTDEYLLGRVRNERFGMGF